MGTDMSTEEKLVSELSEKKLKITFAESCTGGLVSARLVNVAGSSAVFDGSLCSYANDVKMRLLGVSRQVLDEKGAVSAACALQMAEGAAALFKTDIAVSVTGIAGPGGGSPSKPVGTVYICCTASGKSVIKRFRFRGDRQEVRSSAAEAALRLALSAADRL